MAITIDDFSKIWASTSPLTPYAFSESNYKEGWNFVGATPPSRQMWDYQQNLNDLKTQYLFDNTAKAFNWQPSTAYTVGNSVKTPSLPPECVLICTTAGTSDATEPDYTGVNIGDTISDGTCEWLVSSYLPITGGAMTGAITAPQQFVKREVDDDYLALSGGSDGDSGAVLGLSGKDRTGGFSGQFSLYAKDGVNSKALVGKPDGTLTWDGKAIIVGTEATETFNNISINGNIGYASVTLQHTAKYCTVNVDGTGSQRVIPHLLYDFSSVYLVNLNTTNVTVDVIVNYIY